MIKLRLNMDILGYGFDPNPLISKLLGNYYIFSKICKGDQYRGRHGKLETSNYGNIILQEPKYHEIEIKELEKLKEYIKWYPHFIGDNGFLFEKYLVEYVNLWIYIIISPEEEYTFNLFDSEMIQLFTKYNIGLPITICDTEDEIKMELINEEEQIMDFQMSLEFSGEDFKVEEFLKALPEKVHINSKQNHFISLSHPVNIVDKDGSYKYGDWNYSFIKDYYMLLKKYKANHINIKYEFYHLYDTQCNYEIFDETKLKQLCEEGIPISVKVQSRFYKSTYKKLKK